ncbi:hypothetical protein J3F83DRAFT_715779 [Trichoderma novae-zelandiae]
MRFWVAVAPGTAKPGTNGCISHCGSDVVGNDQVPDSFEKIGYYEAFGYDRDCLAMHPKSIPKDTYTHVHFAFAMVTDKFDVDISSYDDTEFSAFKEGGYKKVLSVEGWDFSTASDTFQRFRQAITSANRGSFVNNLVNFMKEDINGFDFNWEYPGAGDTTTKIVVGVTSYGRSFRMADQKCSEPTCTFLGGKLDSKAYKGRCTATAGHISNAETAEIINNHGNYSILNTYIDGDSASNILEYGNNRAVDWEDNPGTLEGIAIADVIGNVNNRCLSYFTLERLYSMLVESLSLFDEKSHDYDDKFKDYEEWIKELVDPKLDDYMRFGDGPGNQFFTCHWEAGSRSGTDPCTSVPHFWELEQTFSVEYELTDEEGFYDDVAASLGIDREWIAWGDRDKNYDCAAEAEDMPRRPYGNGNMPVCRRIYRRRRNVPVKASDDDIVMANPKEMVENAWTNITALQESLLATFAEVAFDMFQDATVQVPELDAVVALAMPVLQLAESINRMKDIKDIGERVMQEKKRELIFKILTIVFMALPVVGEALGPPPLLVSETGNAAVTIADIAKDPASAPFAMLGLIVGGGGGGGGKLSRTESLGEASKARSLMKAADLAEFPQEVSR